MAGYSGLVTPAAGFTIIVKTMYFNNTAATAALLVVEVVAAGAPSWMQLFSITIDPAKSSSWEGWLVLNGNDALRIYSNSAGPYVWVSGTELLGDSPYTPPTNTATLLPAPREITT